MYWWMWALAYVVIAMTTFRVVYLKFKDKTQRWWHEGQKKDQHNRPRQSELREAQFNNRLLATAVALLFPLATVVVTLVGLFYLARLLLFPRGIKTKFDREQELERRKVKEEAEYAIALKVLDWNQNE